MEAGLLLSHVLHMLLAGCCPAAAFGFGSVQAIMGASDKYKRSQRTAAGADKWLDMRLWEDTSTCLTGLKAAGYQVVVTSLTQHSVTIQVSRGRRGRRRRKQGSSAALSAAVL